MCAHASLAGEGWDGGTQPVEFEIVPVTTGKAAADALTS